MSLKRVLVMQVVLLLICVAAVGSNSLVLSPILSDVARSFGATAAEVARAAAAYGGATAFSALFLGRLTDILGGRRALTLGLLALSTAMILCALSWRWETLALAQAMAGLGAGILLPGAYAMASRVAQPGKEARVMGRVLTGWSVSLVAGVPLSALVTDMLGWRSVFVGLGVIAGLVMLGCQALPTGKGPGGTRKGNSPLAVLKIPAVAPILAICMAFMTAFYGVYAFLGDFIRLYLGLTAGEAGMIVLSYGAGFGLAGVGDRLIDRFGARRLFPLILLSIAVVYLAMIPAVESFAGIMVIAFIWGLVNHFCVNILILLLSRADAGRRAAILGVNSAVTYLGAMVGAGLFGEVYAAAGFMPLLLMAASFLMAAAVIAVFVGNRFRTIAAATRPGM